MRKLFTLMLSLLALCLPAAAQDTQPDVVLEFKGNTNSSDDGQALSGDNIKNNLSSGQDFVASVSGPSRVYLAGTDNGGGLKLGASGGAGSFTLNVAESYQREIEKIVVSAKKYKTDASSITVNGIKSAETLAADFSDLTYTGFSGVISSLQVSTTGKRAYIKSISIYFKELEQVATPEISFADNVVTITCATEDASILYSKDGRFPEVDYVDPFSITEGSYTVKAIAKKAGMADSQEARMECVYVEPQVVPDKPVVTIGGEVVTEDCEKNVDYNTVIEVSAKNATKLKIESMYGPEQTIEGSYGEFYATADEIYTITPSNRVGNGTPISLAVTINAPEITGVSYDGGAIENYGEITVKAGTEVTVDARSYSEITVDNDGVAVTVTDGKFAIGNEGSYLITVSNPAHKKTAELLFNVTHLEETEYEVNETLTWKFKSVETKDKATDKKNRVVTLEEGSASGNWVAQCSETTYTGSNNGLQLGSTNDNYEGGKLVLSESEIPGNAVILSVTLTGRSASDGTSTWKLSVNNTEFESPIVIAGTTESEYKFENVNLVGNEIAFAASSVAKAVYIKSVEISYYILAEPSAPVLLDKPASISDGTKLVWTVEHGKIWYKIDDVSKKSVMARGTAPTTGWVKSNEALGKRFTYEYAAGTNHNIYVKNVVNGKEVLGDAINVQGTVLTGVETVSVESAESVRELYNLQGVRVAETEVVPGVYIERRGGKVAKIVIR